MKTNLLLTSLTALMLSPIMTLGQNNVGIGTNTPDPSAVVDMTATDKGMLVPRVTTIQRTGIAAPAEGLLVYDTDFECFFYYKLSTGWVNLCEGIVGPAGPTGPAGADGATGPQGPQGPAGADGATGPQGPQGPAGADGATGPQGLSGPAGADGATGPQGLSGPAGPIGATGPQGPQGPAGPIGATGPQGPQGPAGAIGATGPQGPQGPAGAIGATGPQGPAGATGATGPQGLPGVATFYSATGTTDASTTSTTFVAFPQMTLTFTPTKTVVYVMFSAAGHATPTGSPQQYVDFRLRRNGTVVAGSTSVTTDDAGAGSVTSWNAQIIVPVTVTPGVSTTIDIQWENGGLTNNTTFCNAGTQKDWSHRSLIIME